MGSITVNRNELGDALTFASLALPKRPGLPVLGGMRVTVSLGTLELAAFDYETSTRVKVSGQATRPADVLVSGRELVSAVRSLPRGEKITAELDITDEAITITSDGILTIVPVMSDEAKAEYPQLPKLPEQSGVIDGETFARSVARVAAVAGTDDTLPVLTCVNITSDAGRLELAATDRYRLGLDRAYWTGEDGVSANVSAALLTKFAKAADKTGKVSLHFGDGFAGFSDGIRTLITHVNPGEFPKSVRSFIRDASDNDSMILADAKSLHDAVARAGKLTERNMPIGFDVADGKITVTARRDGQAVGTQHVQAELDGPDQEYHFNAEYLASILAGFTGPVWVGLKTKTETRTNYAGETSEHTSQAPAMLTADGDTFTAILMPIRPKQS